eukprot:g25703.t1
MSKELALQCWWRDMGGGWRWGDGRRGIYTLEWMHDQGFTITRAHVDVVARSKQPGSFLQTRGVRVMSSAEATQEVSSQRSESMPLKDFLATVKAHKRAAGLHKLERISSHAKEST